MVEAAGIETCAASTESLWFQALSAPRRGVRPECRHPMIVSDRYIIGVARASPEADAPLLVDSNILFSISVARQPLQPVSGARSDLDMTSAPNEGNVRIHPYRENCCLSHCDPGDGFPDLGGV